MFEIIGQSNIYIFSFVRKSSNEFYEDAVQKLTIFLMDLIASHSIYRCRIATLRHLSFIKSHHHFIVASHPSGTKAGANWFQENTQ